ncbi:MAG: right-handed parallel beta-helix repeat-containing protein [Roseburia sp.]|nr:right-handed parallel beta-helix repeat-containing protein [Roseburia sp.]
MKSKKLISALLVLAVAGSAATAVGLAACKKKSSGNGRTIYVAADGREEGSGSESDPREIASTLADGELRPGDTVLLKPGVYNISRRTMIVASGEYNKYITFKSADPTKETVLSFYEMSFASTNRGVQVYGNYIHWDGIDIRGAGDNGMYIGGSYNIVENSRFYDNRDTGLQLGRSYSPDKTNNQYLEYDDINYWPSYNLIKNCTSYNNYDNETYGENADGFAAKLTVGYGNVFDGCVAYRNSDDGWDLFAKTDSGNIGAVIIYNCVAFENGFLMETQESFNSKFASFNPGKREEDTLKYTTRDGDGNGFKLGGSIMEGEVFLTNCLSFNNRMHGVTDNSNPGVITVDGVTAYNNGANVDRTGVIAYTGNGVDEGSANIDLARWTYSYNHAANILSVNNGNTTISSDAYRGTMENCTFQGVYQEKDSSPKEYIAYTVSGQAEFNSKTGDRGTRGAATAASTLFKELPTNDLGISKDSAGKFRDFHTEWRNADGSLNLGDLFALVNAEGTQGSKLNLSGWDDYPHYTMHDLSKCTSKDDATAQAIIDMCYLPIRLEACYQNFDLVTKIMNVEIKWESSNPNIINVTGVKGSSNSKHEDVKIEVIRPVAADTKVTLTATVKVGEVTKTKEFEINVKKNTFRIGDFIIGDSVMLEGDAIIKDKGESKFSFRAEKPQIVNSTSNSGAIISDAYYQRDPLMEFATYDNPTAFATGVDWDATKAGIWRVTETIGLKDDVELAKAEDGNGLASKVVDLTYYIYIADAGAANDFSGESSLAVNRYGYTLAGSFVSPTGYIYSVSLPADSAEPDVAAIKANPDVSKQEFRATATSFQFEQNNTADYDVYYFLEDLEGNHQSKVYKKSVKTVSISTKAQFEAMLASNNASTVYLLTQDIDMGGAQVSVSTTPFVGVFNGNGHAINNFKASSASTTKGFGLFQFVQGGSIMNVTFSNGVIADNGSSERTGIIGQMEGGYVYNVKVHNLDVNIGYYVAGTKYTAEDNVEGTVDADGYLVGEGGKRYDKDGAEVDADGYKLDKNGDRIPKRVSSRVGGLIGQVAVEKGDGARTYIERVSVTCDKDNDGNYLHSIRGDQRVGAIVGYIQAGNAARWTNTYITDCYVDALIESNTYGAGIVGRSDDRNKSDILEIARCYFIGENRTQKYCGGILGGFTGTGKLFIMSTVSYGRMFYTDEPYEVLSCEKNCSNIVGYYASNGDATIRHCYSKFAEHNAGYDVMPFGYQDEEGNIFTSITNPDFWTDYLTTYDSKLCESSTVWDLENVWELVQGEYGMLGAPYAKLR